MSISIFVCSDHHDRRRRTTISSIPPLLGAPRTIIINDRRTRCRHLPPSLGAQTAFISIPSPQITVDNPPCWVTFTPNLRPVIATESQSKTNEKSPVLPQPWPTIALKSCDLAPSQTSMESACTSSHWPAEPFDFLRNSISFQRKGVSVPSSSRGPSGPPPSSCSRRGVVLREGAAAARLRR